MDDDGSLIVENYKDDPVIYVFNRPFNMIYEPDTMLRYYVYGAYPLTLGNGLLYLGDAETAAHNILNYLYEYLYDGEGRPLHRPKSRPQWYS